MMRVFLHCLRLIIGLAVLLLVFCLVLAVVALPDIFEDVEKQIGSTAAYDNFLQTSYRNLAFQGVVVVAILASLVLVFIKTTRLLKNLK